MKLILLPGLHGTEKLFAPLIAELDETISIQMITLAGGDYAELTSLIQAELPRDEDYIILAESFSGALALSLAQEAEPGLRAVIFVASFLSCPSIMLRVLSPLLPLNLLISLRPPNLLVRRYLLGPEASPPQIDSFREIIKGSSGRLMAQRLRLIGGLKFEPGQKIDLPCYYLQANEDRLVAMDKFDEFELAFAKVSLRRLSGPHLLCQTRPAECAAIIESILAMY